MAKNKIFIITYKDNSKGLMKQLALDVFVGKGAHVWLARQKNPSVFIVNIIDSSEDKGVAKTIAETYGCKEETLNAIKFF